MLSPRALCAFSAAGGDIVEWRNPNDHQDVRKYVVAFASLQQSTDSAGYINVQSSYRDSDDKSGYEVLVVEVSSCFEGSCFSFVLVLSCCRLPGLPLTYVRKLSREDSDNNRTFADTTPRMQGNDKKLNPAVAGIAADKKHRWVSLEDLRSAGASDKGRPLKGPGGCSFTNGPVMEDKGTLTA